MTAAAPSRGGARGRAPGATAPETTEQKKRRNARQRRYLDRKILRQAVGRFLVTEDLVTALVATRAISDDEAATIGGIEQGVAGLLQKFVRDHTFD